MAEPMYSTDEAPEGELPEPGDFEKDQDPEDRAPRPGHSPAPGERPSESGSTPSDIETDTPTRGEREEPDVTGRPELVAHPEDEHPLEAPESIRRPTDESGEDDLASAGATPADPPA